MSPSNNNSNKSEALHEIFSNNFQSMVVSNGVSKFILWIIINLKQVIHQHKDHTIYRFNSATYFVAVPCQDLHFQPCHIFCGCPMPGPAFPTLPNILWLSHARTCISNPTTYFVAVPCQDLHLQPYHIFCGCPMPGSAFPTPCHNFLFYVQGFEVRGGCWVSDSSMKFLWSTAYVNIIYNMRQATCLKDEVLQFQ